MNASRHGLPVWVVALFALATTSPASVFAQCSSGEMVSVLVLQNVDLPEPLPDIWLLERTRIAPLGPISYPTDTEILAAINATNGTDCPQELRTTVGDFRVYWGCAWDFITATIVDTRTGEVPFSGWVHWAGLGSIIVPSSSTHSPVIVPGPPAASPAELAWIPNSLWEFPDGPTDAVSTLRETDLFHAYADCGEYTVAGYTYTPRVGYPEADVREAARLVLIVRGRLGPPWTPVSIESDSWARIKAMYRGGEATR